MLKGNNTLSLNQATMVEVVQQWVNSQFKEAGKLKVTGVKETHDGGARVFEISVEEITDVKG